MWGFKQILLAKRPAPVANGGFNLPETESFFAIPVKNQMLGLFADIMCGKHYLWMSVLFEV